MAENFCGGCGAASDRSLDLPAVDRCSACPPEVCEVCGYLDHVDVMCRCWVSVESLSLADAKALFAADGTFNVESDGQLTLSDVQEVRGDE